MAWNIKDGSPISWEQLYEFARSYNPVRDRLKRYSPCACFVASAINSLGQGKATCSRSSAFVDTDKGREHYLMPEWLIEVTERFDTSPLDRWTPEILLQILGERPPQDQPSV